MLMFLIVVGVLFVLGVCVAGWVAIGLIVHGSRAKKKAETNAPAILDKAFDGSSAVVFKINSESPEYETVILGARARGYQLLNETDTTEFTKTLIFEKAPVPVTDPQPRP